MKLAECHNTVQSPRKAAKARQGLPPRQQIATGKPVFVEREAEKGEIQFVLGIDPGVSCGFAVYSRTSQKLIRVETLTFWEAIEEVRLFAADWVKVVIEVADAAPVFWQRKGAAANQHTLSKIARNVGQVTREAQLMVEGLRRYGYQVIEAKPLGKKNAEDFKRLTKWTERTNQHERDAGILAFGM